jgi:hypothetical protein
MISYQRLPGRASQESLNGISDWFGMPSFVRQYWEVVKANIKNIKDTGPKITAYWSRISNAQQKLVARGDTQRAALLDDEMKKIADDMQKWSKVNGYIDTYLPQWAGLDQNVTVQPGSGVGAVPFIIAGMALTALAYVVNVGMALVQDYAFKSQLTQAVIDQKISSGQMTEILSVPKSEGIFEKVVSTVGVGAAFGIPTALMIGAGAYLLIGTSTLNTILKAVGLGGTSKESGG